MLKKIIKIKKIKVYLNKQKKVESNKKEIKRESRHAIYCMIIIFSRHPQQTMLTDNFFRVLKLIKRWEKDKKFFGAKQFYPRSFYPMLVKKLSS